MWICFFSPWPTPITAFLTAFGAYSATGNPARAGTSMAMPRAWPSFSVARILVDEGLFDGGLIRLVAMHDFRKTVVQLAKARGQVHVAVRGDGSGGDEAQGVAERIDNSPTRAAQAGINTDDADRVLHASPYSTREITAIDK